ncbi:MAG: FtsX-like permease family protein [Cytophagales bacterium]|nr:FtsX-like permease family protein [Cytophagales bacterium]
MNLKQPHQPPFLAHWLLNKFLSKYLLEEIEGDLQEVYQDRIASKGRLYASLMYWIDMLHLSVGFMGKEVRPMNNWSMFKHYFVISCRNLSKDKGYSLVNISSLAVGMGICLALAQYIFSEFNHDPSLRDHPHIYRLTLERSLEGSLEDRDLLTAHSLGTIASEEIQGIASFTRLYVPDEGAFVSRYDQRPISMDPSEIYYVDRNFLDFFHLKLQLGDPSHALDDLFNVVISERISKRHFGNSNPIGQTLSIGGGASHGDYLVTGVIADQPENSHLQFDFLFPIKNFITYGWMGAVKRNPHIPWFVNYFELSPHADKTIIQQRIDEIIHRHKPEWNPELMLTESSSLQPISDIHLDNNRYANGDYVTNKGNPSDLNSYLIIAAIILVIAWFNYINLSTAQSMKRAGEVGIRKSMGANRAELVFQFLSEAVTINLLAAICGLGISFLALEILGDLLGKELSFTLFSKFEFWLITSLSLLGGALISGIYPAFIMSGHQPISMLSGKTNLISPKYNLRQVLVTFQFLISILLIAGTFLIYKQIDYMQNEDLGMDIDQVLVVHGPKHIEVLDGGPQLTDYEGLQAFKKYNRKMYKIFRDEVQKIPAVGSITGSWYVPGDPNFDLQDDIRRWGSPESENQTVRLVQTGLDFIKTYNLKLIAGKEFTPDLFDSRAIILNEKAVQAFGFDSPEEAVGDQLYFRKPLKIVGVVKDFHWHSLKEDHFPWIIWLTGSTPGYLSMKLNALNLEKTIPQIQEIYDQLYPGNPFEYFFMDVQFNQQYQSELQFRNLFLSLTVLAILIACIGLFAMISYAVTLKVKEIGIRKVLGASLTQLMILLSKEYFRLLALAIILALPLISFIGDKWLENYAFRTNPGPDLYIIPGCILILIAILTVSHRTLVAAQANPVDSLRAE